jgi:hypothetical protein
MTTKIDPVVLLMSFFLVFDSKGGEFEGSKIKLNP